MKTLATNWFFEDLFDVEYKRYVLLAYLQEVHKEFNQTKLYPALADLVTHYRNLVNFKRSKDELYQSFPEYIQQVDLKHFFIKFQKAVSNDEMMEHLQQVIDFSLPAMQKHLEEGKEIYEFVEREIELEPVGILPMYRNEGYLFIKSNEIFVYEFQVSLFSHDTEPYRAVATTYLTSYESNYVNTCENIKIDLIRHHKKLPNPAVFSVATKFDYPILETIMPITKRLMMKYVA